MNQTLSYFQAAAQQKHNPVCEPISYTDKTYHPNHHHHQEAFQQNQSLESPMVDNKYFPSLSQNLLEILDDNEYHDITIEVGNDPYIKVFRAHMVILYYRSPYLRRILSTNEKKNDGTLVHIKLPNILPETFQIILRYIYCGSLSLKEHDTSDIIKILIAANELDLQELITYIQSFLIANLTEQNFDLIYQTSFENGSFLELQKHCTDLISKEPDKIFKSPNFSSIPEKLLVSLIQNDNLQMSVTQIWEHVLKWGFAQNPELPSNPASFSKDNFNDLKNSLQQCIPFIKFSNLTSKEFFDKVLPYEKVLPKELYRDLLNSFLDNEQQLTKEIDSNIKKNSPNSIDSKIITIKHVELISKWIDRLDNMNTSSYKFKLLFSGSRDGFASSNFHKICDNKPRTVAVIKVRDSSEILGGYNPIEWKSNCSYGITKDSFIFSFESKNSIKNYILSRVKNERTAIANNPHIVSSFGSGDLIIFGNNFYNCGSCEKRSYEKPISIEEKFSVEDFEIFQIIED